MKIPFFLIALLLPSLALSNQDYTQTLCEQADYHCLSIQRGDSWLSLFPNESQRDIVRRVNRMNILLKPGMLLAIPNKLSNINVFDLAPFPRYVKSKGEPFIQINKQTLAWAAFNKEGEMLWWGPISPGIADCHDEKTGCLTPSGQFRLIRKKGLNCKSNAYPNFVDGSHGGAIMPFCMFFHKGYSLHGSYSLPGYPSSHGCILLFIEDAQWLNEQFVNVEEDGGRGTLVLIE